MMGLVLIAQLDPAVVEYLDRIATMQTVMGITMVLITLVAGAVGVAAVMVLLLARRQMKEVQETFRRLSPRLEPALERTRHIIDDVGGTVEAVRARVDDVTETVTELNDSLRAAVEEAEHRVREFGSVLNVVQEEAQTLLIESAATARGIHTTAAALRRPRQGRLPTPDGAPTGTVDRAEPTSNESRRVSHGQG